MDSSISAMFYLLCLNGSILVNAEFFFAFFILKIQERSLPISNSSKEVAISVKFCFHPVSFPLCEGNAMV